MEERERCVFPLARYIYHTWLYLCFVAALSYRGLFNCQSKSRPSRNSSQREGLDSDGSNVSGFCPRWWPYAYGCLHCLRRHSPEGEVLWFKVGSRINSRLRLSIRSL